MSETELKTRLDRLFRQNPRLVTNLMSLASKDIHRPSLLRLATAAETIPSQRYNPYRGALYMMGIGNLQGAKSKQFTEVTGVAFYGDDASEAGWSNCTNACSTGLHYGSRLPKLKKWHTVVGFLLTALQRDLSSRYKVTVFQNDMGGGGGLEKHSYPGDSVQKYTNLAAFLAALRAAIQPGDLVFWSRDSTDPSQPAKHGIHVAVVVGYGPDGAKGDPFYPTHKLARQHLPAEAKATLWVSDHCFPSLNRPVTYPRPISKVNVTGAKYLRYVHIEYV